MSKPAEKQRSRPRSSTTARSRSARSSAPCSAFSIAIEKTLSLPSSIVIAAIAPSSSYCTSSLILNPPVVWFPPGGQLYCNDVPKRRFETRLTAAMPRPKQRTPELRDRVLSAALELLSSVGVAGFTARSVARAAQTSTPAVYELFGDKRGLVRELYFAGFRTLH